MSPARAISAVLPVPSHSSHRSGVCPTGTALREYYQVIPMGTAPINP